jgi:ubiquinone biosynthesis protein UbiJ
MNEFQADLSPESATELIAKLAGLMAQLRVDAEREMQMAYRTGAADVSKTEARTYAKAILHVRERLEPLVAEALSPNQRAALESWIAAEASRRLEAAERADENRA